MIRFLQVMAGVAAIANPLTAAATSVSAPAIDPTARYRLTTAWQGACRSLDIVNDDVANNRVALARSGNFSGQFWHFSRARNGTWYLATEWQGADRPLAVKRTGNRRQVMLADRRDDSAQRWRATALADGSWRLRNARAGHGFSLDVANDGIANDRVVLAATADVSGQYWRITDVRNGDVACP